MSNSVDEFPSAAFLLSLLAGIIILAGSGMMALAIGGSFGGMMGGYLGIMNGYQGMMQGFGSGDWIYFSVIVGLISGIMILVSAMMVYVRPSRISTWGGMIVAFSVLSLFGMAGFFFGGILGVLGGILALTWQRNRKAL